MDKETILKMSRAENQGKQDEREQSIAEKASSLGKNVGLAICVLLALLSDFFLHNREVGLVAWIVFFAMEGCSDLFLYRHNKKRSKLIWGIIEIVCAVIDLTVLVILAVR